MKIYLDTCVISAIGKDDTHQERSGIQTILETFERGECELFTSELAGQEISQYQGNKSTEWIYRILRKVPFVSAYTIGFELTVEEGDIKEKDLSEYDYTWGKFKAMGLKDFDAHHVMLSIKAMCNVFLTCDKAILKRAYDIEKEFGICVMKPSELAIEPP